MPAIYKIVFAGPVGAGKTEAVKVLSDIEVVSTEATASDDVRKIKAQTTVAMDYGVMKLANGDIVRLYGTPGQERFMFMWEILSETALGIVLLLDGSAADPVADLKTYVAHFRRIIDQTALVVGITHIGWGDRQLRPAVAAELARLGLPPVVMDADARSRSEMATLVRSLIYSLDPLHEAR
ncbi:MAG: ATP/GTP-binding protein [Burkholderiales bacterium]|nr:ATP/GTP-binding protein [Burkholderiales bacterium]